MKTGQKECKGQRGRRRGRLCAGKQSSKSAKLEFCRGTGCRLLMQTKERRAETQRRMKVRCSPSRLHREDVLDSSRRAARQGKVWTSQGEPSWTPNPLRSKRQMLHLRRVQRRATTPENPGDTKEERVFRELAA